MNTLENCDEASETVLLGAKSLPRRSWTPSFKRYSLASSKTTEAKTSSNMNSPAATTAVSRRRTASWSSISLDHQELDLALDSDLCLPDESLISEASSRLSSRGDEPDDLLFPWMADAEIV